MGQLDGFAGEGEEVAFLEVVVFASGFDDEAHAAGEVSGADDSCGIGGNLEVVGDRDLHAHIHRGLLQRNMRDFSYGDSSQSDRISWAQSLYFEKVGEQQEGSVGGVGLVDAVRVCEQQREQEEDEASVDAVSEALLPSAGGGGMLRGFGRCQGGGGKWRLGGQAGGFQAW